MGMPLAHRRFTVDEYHRMGDAGVFHEDDHVELIEGQIVEMTPIGPEHAAGVDRVKRALARRVDDRAVVRVQDPVRLDRLAEPQPDIALLRPPIERYAHAHPAPGDLWLVIEVADTPREYDRSVKLPLYARASADTARPLRDSVTRLALSVTSRPSVDCILAVGPLRRDVRARHRQVFPRLLRQGRP